MSSPSQMPTTAVPTQTQSLPMDKVQMDALQVIWNSLNQFTQSGGGKTTSWKNCNNPWTFGASVYTSTVVCNGQWCGVSCDSSTPPNINGLSLKGMNLNGAIPTQVGDLRHLETLQLSNNRISGQIPDTISRISGLRTLDLSQNVITGTLPPQLGNLYALREFNVQNTLVKGQVPKSYCNLVEVGTLQQLVITQCGGLTCYQSCLDRTSGTVADVVSHDPSLEICGQTGGGGGTSRLVVTQTDDQQTITIAAAVAGGVIGLICIIGVVCLLLRAKRKKEESQKVSVVINNGGAKKDQGKARPGGKTMPQKSPPRTRGANGEEEEEEEDDDAKNVFPDEEVGNPMTYNRPPPGLPGQGPPGQRDTLKPMLKPLPLSSKLGAQKPPLKMELEMLNQTAPEHTPGDTSSSSAAAPFQQKRFTLKPMGASAASSGLTPPRAPAPPQTPETEGAKQGGPGLLDPRGPGGGGSVGSGSGSGSGGSSEGQSGDEGSDEEHHPGGGGGTSSGGEQRFMMGINPLAGRGRMGMGGQAHAPGGGGEDAGDHRRTSGMPRGPIMARTPTDQSQQRRPTGTPGPPSNMAIRPEMQEAAMAQAKRLQALQPPRPPAPPPVRR